MGPIDLKGGMNYTIPQQAWSMFGVAHGTMQALLQFLVMMHSLLKYFATWLLTDWPMDLARTARKSTTSVTGCCATTCSDGFVRWQVLARTRWPRR